MIRNLKEEKIHNREVLPVKGSMSCTLIPIMGVALLAKELFFILF